MRLILNSREQFAYAIRRLGWYQPLGARPSEWVNRWNLCHDVTSDERRAAVWHLCDRPLFEVRRVEVSDE